MNTVKPMDRFDRNLHATPSVLRGVPGGTHAADATPTPHDASPPPVSTAAPERLDFLRSVKASAPPEEMKQIVRSLCVDGEPPGKIVGASLLCFTIDPVWFRVYFLLGKERHIPGWRRGSGKWSEFGGSVSRDAPTAEETAAKEFLEETLAVVKFFERDTLPRPDYGDIAQSLKRGEYIFKINVVFGTVEEPRHHVTFIKQIPWDPDAPTRFKACRDLIIHAHTQPTQTHTTRDPAPSPYHDLVGKNPCMRRSPHATVGATTTPALPLHVVAAPTRAHTHTHNHTGWQYVRSAHSKKKNAQGSTRTITPPRACLPALARAAESRGLAESSRRGVCLEFLEKQALGLWSIPQLQRAVEFKGLLSTKNIRGESCKDSFITLLELVLSELAFLRPSLFD